MRYEWACADVRIRRDLDRTAAEMRKANAGLRNLRKARRADYARRRAESGRHVIAEGRVAPGEAQAA